LGRWLKRQPIQARAADVSVLGALPALLGRQRPIGVYLAEAR
jgi:hypothetical protein